MRLREKPGRVGIDGYIFLLDKVGGRFSGCSGGSIVVVERHFDRYRRPRSKGKRRKCSGGAKRVQFYDFQGSPPSPACVRSGGLRGMGPCLIRLVGHAGVEWGDAGAQESSIGLFGTDQDCMVEIAICCAIVTKPYDRSARAVKDRRCASVWGVAVLAVVLV